MLCKKCGAQIPDDAVKCEYCGEVFVEEADNADMGDTQVIDDAALNNEAAADAVEAEAVNEPEEDTAQRSTHDIFEENAKKRQKQAEQIIDEKQHQLDEITARRNLKKQRQKRNKIILVACVCALVACAAGVGTYYVKNGGFDGTTIISTPLPTISPVPTLEAVSTPSVVTPNPASATPEATAEVQNNSTSSNNTNTSTSSEGNSWKPTATQKPSATAAPTATKKPATNRVSVDNLGKKYSGVVTSDISSRLITGGEVVHDATSDKYFMTFLMDDVTYYANVSKGSTTDQINGKKIEVSANSTSATYNGNTVYEITSMTYYDGEYILPNSSTREIEISEIKDMSKETLALARNEIYARHGRKFNMKEYSEYFESKAWYEINSNYNYSDENSNLSATEIKNVKTILSVENTK